MITLYQAPPAWGLPNVSPFCFKVETYLRMAGLPYRTALGDTRKAPKGKIPWIDHDGKEVGDSTFIIDYLKQRFGDPLDAKLTAEQHATGLVVQRMIEEGLYFVALYARWIEDDGFEGMKTALFGGYPIPPVIKSILPHAFRNKTRKQLHLQGTGRHSRAEVYEIGRRDLVAFSQLLGDKKFFFGDEPTSYDACYAAFLGAILKPPYENPLRKSAHDLASLPRYFDRMWQRYYSDWSAPK
jgi:glutathione S-transferase